MSDVHVGLERVADGFGKPTNGAVAPGDADGLYVSEQSGPLWRIDLRDGTAQQVADLSGLLVPVGLTIAGEAPGHLPDERGFLGVAFHPEFESNGLVYTYTSEPPGTGEPTFPSTLPAGERADHLSVLREWTAQVTPDGMLGLDPTRSQVLFRIAEPQWNHNGGEIVFGPDGMLYVQIGDGGGADDQDGQLWWVDPDGDGLYTVGPIVGHPGPGNGQNLGVPLGKILRIDVDGTGAGPGTYGIPDDNPFVGVEGALEEIWAYGVRNPFQGSFDRGTGEYRVGDVGQNDVEEIDLVTRGANLGWNVREGAFWFAPRGPEQGSGTVVHEPVQPAPPDLVDPVDQYDHDWGVAVIGGHVYRGLEQPALVGSYVFGDHGGKLLVRSTDGPAQQLRISGDEDDQLGYSVTSFAEDVDGEIYVLGHSHHGPGGGGLIERIVAPTPQGGVDAGWGSTAGRGVGGQGTAVLVGSVLIGAGLLLAGVRTLVGRRRQS